MRKQVLILGHNDGAIFVEIINQYVQCFDPSHYEVTVAYLVQKHRDTETRTKAEHVRFLELTRSSLRYLKLGALQKLFALTREKSFDIVICHRYKPIYLMLWVSLFRRFKIMLGVIHAMHAMRALGRRLFVAAIARKNVLFAGVSDAVRDDLKTCLFGIPSDNIITLHNVIDTKTAERALLSRDAARRALNLPEDALIIGNVGRIMQHKDHATLIQAFAEFAKRKREALLAIIGDGPLTASVHAQIEALGLSKQVLLLGNIADAERYLQAFDGFVLSSIQEAFGRVLIEAMLAKCPIIATRTGGIPEVIGDAGILVPPKNADAIASALCTLYDGEDLTLAKMLSERAYQRVMEHFSIEAFKREFLSYAQLTPLRE